MVGEYNASNIPTILKFFPTFDNVGLQNIVAFDLRRVNSILGTLPPTRAALVLSEGESHAPNTVKNFSNNFDTHFFEIDCFLHQVRLLQTIRVVAGTLSGITLNSTRIQIQVLSKAGTLLRTLYDSTDTSFSITNIAATETWYVVIAALINIKELLRQGELVRIILTLQATTANAGGTDGNEKLVLDSNNTNAAPPEYVLLLTPKLTSADFVTKNTRV